MIKAILLSLFVALLMVGCGDGIVDYDDLENRNGVTYLADEETPFTGRAERFYRNGQKQEEGNFNDDYPNGVATFWYENGQKKGAMNHKDGILMSAEAWKPNGEKCPNTKIKEGNGIMVWYKEDGTEDYESIYKDGELAGLAP